MYRLFAIDHVLVSLVKLLKTVATTGTIFSLQFTKSRLAAGLCPDPMGELKRSPKPSSRNRGPTFKEKGGEGEGREGKERGSAEEREGREGKGCTPQTKFTITQLLVSSRWRTDNDVSSGRH